MRVAENHHADWKAAGLARLYRRWVGPGVLLLIVVLFYWKLVLTNQFTWLAAPDLSNQVLPWFQFEAGEWHGSRFPLWDPNAWAGQPLLGQAQPGAAYPLNWLLFLMPLKNGWIRQVALHWYFVLIHFIAAIAAYALCRDLGRSRRASIVAGCVFALSGYVGTTDWPQMLNGAIWAPLIFLYLFRAERGERPLVSSLLSGFFLGVSWLSGHHQIPIFLSLAVVGSWLWICLRPMIEGGRPDWKMGRLVAMSLGLAVLTSGLQTVPMAEYGRLSVRWVGTDEPLHLNQTVPYKIHEEFSLKPISLLGIVLPGVEGRSNPFVGIVGFALALLGLLLAWRERYVRWLAVTALAGILFALGPNSLLNGVIYALVPMVEKARVPGAATLIFSLGIAPLVAFAIDKLPGGGSGFWSRRVEWTLTGVSALLATASLIFYLARFQVAIADDRMMITALCGALGAVLLAAWRSGNVSSNAGAAAALALVLFELANVSTYTLPQYGDASRDAYLNRMAAHSDIADFVRSSGEAVRVTYNDTDIPYNIGDWFGIETFNAYTASLTENIWQGEMFSPRGQDFFGIRYHLGKAPSRPDQREVFQGKSGIKVFENATAYPRVWAVHEASTVADAAEARKTLTTPGFDPQRTAFLIGQPAPKLETCNRDDEDIQFRQHRPNRVQIRVSLECRGMVILTDTWFPGWRATVDGKSAKIEQAYGNVRGVVVEAGVHVVDMRYQPGSVILGALMSLSAVAIVFAAIRRGRKYKDGMLNGPPRR